MAFLLRIVGIDAITKGAKTSQQYFKPATKQRYFLKARLLAMSSSRLDYLDGDAAPPRPAPPRLPLVLAACASRGRCAERPNLCSELKWRSDPIANAGSPSPPLQSCSPGETFQTLPSCHSPARADRQSLVEKSSHRIVFRITILLSYEQDATI